MAGWGPLGAPPTCRKQRSCALPVLLVRHRWRWHARNPSLPPAVLQGLGGTATRPSRGTKWWKVRFRSSRRRASPICGCRPPARASHRKGTCPARCGGWRAGGGAGTQRMGGRVGLGAVWLARAARWREQLAVEGAAAAEAAVHFYSARFSSPPRSRRCSVHSWAGQTPVASRPLGACASSASHHRT